MPNKTELAKLNKKAARNKLREFAAIEATTNEIIRTWVVQHIKETGGYLKPKKLFAHFVQDKIPDGLKLYFKHGNLARGYSKQDYHQAKKDCANFEVLCGRKGALALMNQVVK